MALESPKSICHVLHTLNVGGAEVLAAAYGRRNRDEFRIVFACLDELGQLGAQLRDEGFTVEVVGRRPGFDLGCARRLARMFREHSVGLVHAHQYGPYFYTALSRLFGARAPILFMEHGRDFPDYPRPKRKLANRLLLRRRDHVVAVGACVKTALEQNEGLPSDRIEVVYNGVDLDRYDPRRLQRDAVRAELGIAPHELAVFQVARLNRLKDHATALRAFAILVGTQPDARLILVGDGEERASIESLRDELKLGDRVRLMGTRSDVARLLQAADGFLLSSVTEGIALTLIEAMATALPVVATAVGGNSEVVVEGETGWLAPAGDPTRLAACLNEMCQSEDLRRRLGAAGERRARELFSGETMHHRYQQLYRQMLGMRV